MTDTWENEGGSTPHESEEMKLWYEFRAAERDKVYQSDQYYASERRYREARQKYFDFLTKMEDS